MDDQDHTADRLRSGAVLAAVTGTARPPAGFNSRPLGAMRYLAAASPAYMARHFAEGLGAGSLARAPSLVFNTKDDLQARWVRRLCHRDVELPRHAVPSAHAFVAAALGGMVWGLHPQVLIASHLANRSLVELVLDTPLDVPAVLAARARCDVVDGGLEPRGAGCRRPGAAASMRRLRAGRRWPASWPPPATECRQRVHGAHSHPAAMRSLAVSGAPMMAHPRQVAVRRWPGHERSADSDYCATTRRDGAGVDPAGSNSGPIRWVAGPRRS